MVQENALLHPTTKRKKKEQDTEAMRDKEEQEAVALLEETCDEFECINVKNRAHKLKDYKEYIELEEAEELKEELFVKLVERVFGLAGGLSEAKYEKVGRGLT